MTRRTSKAFVMTLIAVVTIGGAASFVIWRGKGQGVAPPAVQSTPQPTADVEDVLEAALRDVLSDGPNDALCFVGLRDAESDDWYGEDPSDAFLSRLSNLKLPLRKCSESELTPETTVRDKASGKSGYRVGVGPLRWTGATEAEVECWWYASGLGAMHCITEMRTRDGQWVVVRRKQVAMS